MNNSLKYVKILESAGVTREQAEAHVQMISEVLEVDLAAKQDIKNLNMSLESRFDSIEHKFKSIEHRILESEYRMTIKLGSIVTIALATLAAIIKFI